MAGFNKKDTIEYLTFQFQENRPILMAGAGFSRDAKDSSGRALPTGSELAEEIWHLCQPDRPFEPGNTLADLFQLALRQRRTALETLLRARLTVDSRTLPDFYRVYFALPWRHIYSLNVDDLGLAVSQRFDLPRRVVRVSATSETAQPPIENRAKDLTLVHLNGTLADSPENVTFSTTQYGERLSGPDHWYQVLAAELVTYPFVFIGTSLDESPLWQHIAMRGVRGRRVPEHRPKSYVVTPSLSHARQELLHEHSALWVPLTAAQFADQILAPILHSLGNEPFELLQQRAAQEGRPDRIWTVTELAAQDPQAKTEYLLGQEPVWADIISGRAIRRSADEELLELATTHLGKPGRSLALVVTGTAGSGKSTSILRLCLALSNTGHVVGYLGRESLLAPHEIVRQYRQAEKMHVVAIDDADRHGHLLSRLVNDLCEERRSIVVVGLRSNQLSRWLRTEWVTKGAMVERTMPHLTDGDIDDLIDTLTRNRRLGRLTGLSRDEQREAFRRQANRQLLVAMYDATSHDRFEDKAIDEFRQLADREQVLYAIAALATQDRFSVTREELLIACGEASNDTLRAIDDLVRRHLLVHPSAGQPTQYAVRHRMIAEIVVNDLIRQKQLTKAIGALTYALASAVSVHRTDRRSRQARMLRRLTHNRYLGRVLDVTDVREVYDTLEELLSWDYHYWLQRGTFEVQWGDLSLAASFLNAAKGLNPGDHMVATEYAHLVFKRAIENPRSEDSAKKVEECAEILEDQIRSRGEKDDYPYHVLGSQGLGWVRRAPLGRKEKREFLQRLVDHLVEARKRHPWSDRIRQLHGDLEKELLMTAVA